jgi:lipopolysaccharide/colanic/teichoic acid biosynthesis glycosyltransferase
MNKLRGEEYLAGPYKRALDLGVVSLFGGPALVLGGIASAGLALEMRRKPWFVQPRVGQGTKTINTLKLVTLRGPIEHTPSYSGYDHERASRIGKVVRKLHIDEGPQLLTVARGEMSAVGGYRPLVEEDHNRVMDSLSPGEQFQYLRALEITKPAIVTPLSQHQHRDAAVDPYERGMSAIEYAHTATFVSDMQLLLSAGFAVSKGAIE